MRREIKVNKKETPVDALRWVMTVIKQYEIDHDPTETLHWIKSEIQTCLTIASIPDFEGTRFREDIIMRESSITRKLEWKKWVNRNNEQQP